VSAVRFDTRAFVEELGAGLREHVKSAGVEASVLGHRIDVLEEDAAATLEAIKVEQDVERRMALRVDLECFLPERKAFLLSAAESLMSSEAKAVFETALDVTVRVLVAAAKALSPIPIP
jgi:hypothetical protein